MEELVFSDEVIQMILTIDAESDSESMMKIPDEEELLSLIR